jgi:hypothetical protein
MKFASQCVFCKHLRPVERDWQCVTFPDGVPDDVYYNRHDHRQPYPGDQGIRWEPAEEGDEDFWDEDEDWEDEAVLT